MREVPLADLGGRPRLALPGHLPFTEPRQDRLRVDRGSHRTILDWRTSIFGVTTSASTLWMSEAMGALRRDFLPEELVREQAASGVDGSIAVQARQSLTETRWLLELAAKNPRIRGVVGWRESRRRANRGGARANRRQTVRFAACAT